MGMKSIVRHDMQERHTNYLKQLAEGEGREATDEAAPRRSGPAGAQEGI